jgi:hypothetical protein
MQCQKPILEMQFIGLSKIISGGQVGADRGALEAAREIGILTGGYAPRGWRTATGSDPSLAEFGLVEHFRSEYKFRTEKNIEESDGTLVVASNTLSPGTALTISSCHIIGKPFYVISPKQVSEYQKVVEWIMSECIQVLNVAGNRDKYDSRIHHDAAYDLVKLIVEQLKRDQKLNIQSR